MDLNIDHAFDAYNARFNGEFGSKPIGSFSKFSNVMVQRLEKNEFGQRLSDYLEMHAAVKRILDIGATISDDICLEFQERACWLVIQAPNILDMFKGEVGDPSVARGEQPS